MIPMQAGKGLTCVASVSNNIYILKKQTFFFKRIRAQWTWKKSHILCRMLKQG